MDKEIIFRTIKFFSKFFTASVVAGIILSQMQFKPNSLFNKIGINRQEISSFITEATEWVVPHFMMGAMFILPLWLLIHLFRPPKN